MTKEEKKQTEKLAEDFAKELIQEANGTKFIPTAKTERTYERHDIENTPFSAIKIMPDNIWKITITNQIISTKNYKDIEEIKTELNGIPWEIILNTCALMCEQVIKINNQQKNSNND